MGFGWDDVIAGVGGAAEGAVEQQRFNRQQDIREQLNELRGMIATMQEGGKNTRAEADLKYKKDKADEDRALKTKQIVDTSERGYAKMAQDADLGWGRIGTTERGQDLEEGRFWGGTMPLGWARNATTERGQNITARGQDITATTARRGQDLTHQDRGRAIDATSDSRAMSYALGAYGKELQRRKQNQANIFATEGDETPTFSDWLQTSDDPEIFPSVKRMFAPTAQAATPAGTPPAAAAPGAPPAAPVPKGPPPVDPKVNPLEQQARQLLDRIRALEAAGQDASALRQQLAALRAQVKR